MRVLVAAMLLLALLPLAAPPAVACHPEGQDEAPPQGPVWIGHRGCGAGTTACVWVKAEPWCADLP